MPEQWNQLHSHCERTAGPDHALLKIMLRQSKCALCDYPTFYGGRDWITRALYEHEERAHNSAAMFHIDSFVVLARERRILSGNGGHMALEPTCRRVAFDRMMAKVQLLPNAALRLLYKRSGFDDDEYSVGNLAWILTHDPLAPLRGDDPYWKPLPPDRFLAFCRPHHDEPAGSSWRRVWRSLRDEYADGHI